VWGAVDAPYTSVGGRLGRGRGWLARAMMLQPAGGGDHGVAAAAATDELLCSFLTVSPQFQLLRSFLTASEPRICRDLIGRLGRLAASYTLVTKSHRRIAREREV
jgi:hypothetical protein